MNAQQQAERQAAWKLAVEIYEILLNEGWTVVGTADWIEIRQAGQTVRVEGDMPWIAPEVLKQAERVWPMRTIMTAAGIHG